MVHKLTLRVVLTVVTPTGDAPLKKDVEKAVEEALNKLDNNYFAIERADVQQIDED